MDLNQIELEYELSTKPKAYRPIFCIANMEVKEEVRDIREMYQSLGYIDS